MKYHKTAFSHGNLLIWENDVFMRHETRKRKFHMMVSLVLVWAILITMHLRKFASGILFMWTMLFREWGNFWIWEF